MFYGTNNNKSEWNSAHLRFITAHKSFQKDYIKTFKKCIQNNEPKENNERKYESFKNIYNKLFIFFPGLFLL